MKGIGWVPVYGNNGQHLTNTKGEPLYTSVPVPKKKGMLYCPYCDSYDKFEEVSWSKHLSCPKCGITTQDFHTKTCNQLW